MNISVSVRKLVIVASVVTILTFGTALVSTTAGLPVTDHASDQDYSSSASSIGTESHQLSQIYDESTHGTATFQVFENDDTNLDRDLTLLDSADDQEGRVSALEHPSTIEPGEELTVTVETEASVGTIVEFDPEGFDVNLSTDESDAVRVGDTSVEFIDVGGSNSTYTIHVEVTNATDGDTAEIAAWVNSEDRNEADDIDTSTVTVDSDQRGTISALEHPDTIEPGEEFTVTVETEASAGTIVEFDPEGFDVDLSTDNSDAVRVRAKSVEFLDVSAGNSTYTIKAEVIDAIDGDTAEIAALVNSDNRSEADDIETSTVTVESDQDGTVNALEHPDTVGPGEEFTVTVETEASAGTIVEFDPEGFDVNLSTDESDAVRVGDTSVEFIDVADGNSTYTINAEVINATDGDIAEIATWVNSEDRNEADDIDTSTVTVDSEEEAMFELSIDDAPDSVTEGEDIDVNFTVENTGDEADTQDINFLIEGNSEATEKIQLEGGETFSGGFTYTTTGDEIGEVTLDVISDDDSATDNVTVGTLEFEIEANETSIVAGDPVRFTVTDDEGSPVDATVELPDTVAPTGNDGNTTIRIGSVGSIRATATKDLTTTEYASNSVQITVASPTLTISESEVEFGTVSLGETAQTELTLENNASTDVAVDDVDLFGADSGEFGINETTVPETVGADSTHTVGVEFAPRTRSSSTARFGIGDDTIPLEGSGVAPQINVTSELPIELTAEQGTSSNTTIQIINDGNAELNASLATDEDAFSQPATIDIPAGSTQSVEIRFDSGRIDSSTVSTDLMITPNNSVVSGVSVPVVGTVPERSINVRQSALEFGTTTVGDPVTSAIVVDNTGTTTEQLDASISSENFSLVNGDDASFTLGPGDRERLTIEANLSETGEAVSALVVENDSDSPVVVTDRATLNATGQAPQLSVADSEPVTIGNTPVGSTSTEEIEIDNSGDAPLRVSLDDAFTAAEAANFSVIGETTVEVPANGSRNVTVGGSPQTVGEATANLTLDTNDIGATADTENVTLEATGFETNLRISENLSRFGAVGVGGNETRTLTLENNGSGELELSTAATPESEFTVESAPDTIAGGTTETITVTFAPAADGIRTGELVITGEDVTGNTTTVSSSLAGTGRYAELRLNQETLRTGVTASDSSTTGSVSVSNTGPNGTELTIDSLRVADEGFTVGGGLSTGDTLASGEREALELTFNPDSGAENGQQQTTLTLTSSSSAQTLTRMIPVTGVVTEPEPTVSTDQLSVGTVTLGEETLRTVTVSNSGGEPFNITDISAGRGVTADRIGPSRIVPGGESTVVVAVNRSVTGSFDTNVTIRTDDADPTVGVTGRAVAPEFTLTAESIEFGNTSVGSASQAEITVHNTGNASLTVAQPTITGENDESFRLLSADRQLRIAPGSSQNVSVGFGPSAVGDATASLEIGPLNEPSDTEGTREVTLNGTGMESSATLNTSVVSFGDIQQGMSSNQSLTITNDGTAQLDVTGASILGSDSSGFTISGLGTPRIDPGSSETFTVEVNTTGLDRGSLSSRLVISTDDADVTSHLGATVVAPDIETDSTVAADRFGTTRLGTTSTADLRINNTGNAELNLTTLSVTGADADGFSIVETPENTTIAAQATDRVVVEFDPSDVSNAVSRAENTPLSAAAILNVSSNDPDGSEQSVEVSLNAEAETPSLDVPRTFQFGDIGVGSAETGQLTITNTPSATAPLNITEVELSGADAADYTATLDNSDTPTALHSGESATINVTLTPSSLDQKYATLSVYTNDSRQPVRKIGLSNTETVYSVEYGSVHVNYLNPTAGTEPTVDVDEGLRGRNATLRSVTSNVSTSEDYGLSYTFGSDPAEVDHAAALETDSVAGTNATAVQYINATTTAAEENFSESTFRTEVSKATLARQDVEPENVSIYHENGSEFDRLETELLFETTQGYVYEATTESYSVFAVGHLDPNNQTNDSSDDGEDTDTSGGDDGGNNGGGGGGGGGSGGPDVSSASRSFGHVATIKSIGGDVATVDIGLSGAGMGISSLTVDGRFDPKQIGLYLYTPTAEPTDSPALKDVEPVGYFRTDLRQASAKHIDESQITFTVDKSVLPADTDPQSVTLYQYIDTDGTWTSLPTDHAGGNTYEATTTEFSEFAIGIRSPQTTTDEDGDEEVQDGNDGTDDDTPGFGPITAIIALSSLAVGFRLRTHPL